MRELKRRGSCWKDVIPQLGSYKSAFLTLGRFQRPFDDCKCHYSTSLYPLSSEKKFSRTAFKYGKVTHTKKERQTSYPFDTRPIKMKWTPSTQFQALFRQTKVNKWEIKQIVHSKRRVQGKLDLEYYTCNLMFEVLLQVIL